MKRVDFFVPTRDESALIEPYLTALDSVLRPLKQSYRVFFIDRSSQDETESVVKKLTLRFPVNYLKVRRSSPYIRAVKAAFACTGSTPLVIMDIAAAATMESLPTALHMSRSHGIVMVESAHLFTVIARRIIAHMPSSVADQAEFKSASYDIARELGYRTSEIPSAVHAPAQSRSQTGRRARTFLGSLLNPKKLPVVEPHRKDSMAGAGVIHHSTTFVTHTTLDDGNSAVFTFTPVQRIFIAALVAALIAAIALWPFTTVKILIAALSCIYFIDIFFNIGIIAKSLREPPEIQFSDSELQSIDESALPVYSILVPLYHESAVLPGFIRAVDALDWPKDKLDVQLLLEENDTETISTARSLNLPSYIRISIVPDSQPKTKPKACNWGLAHAKGELLVIYDAEDIPDPLQLKKAYYAFKTQPDSVRCLQAKLNYFNPHQNLLTRLFSIEYSLWFDVTLPGLQTLNTIIPLGGTSNHFRTADLRDLKGWDPFNVTEDADLGVRLFKKGYRTAIIDSVTLEEANSHLGNWVRQRSRWIKGYMQTFLVHMREVRRFAADHGRHAFYFQMIVGGKLAFMLINPLMWILTLSYFVLRAYVGDAIESLYPGAVFGMAFTSLIFGNFLFIYCYMIGAAKREAWWLMKYVFFQPIYWLFVSAAAGMALVQLFFKPHYWEKTQHGLHLGETVRKPVQKIDLARETSVQTNKGPRISPAITSGSLYVFAAIAVNFLNFAYILYLGKVMPLSVYGVVTLVSTFVYIAQISFTALARSTAYESATYTNPADLTNFASRVRHHALLWGAGTMTVGFLGLFIVVRYFGDHVVLPYVLFVPVLLVGTLYAVETGMLTGMRKYAYLASVILIEVVTKIILGISGVYSGVTTLVYAALPLSVASGLMVARIGARPPQEIAVSSRRRDTVSTASQKTFFWHSFLNRATAYLFMSLDIIFAVRYLSPDAAGSYALLSTVGKVVFFAGSLFAPFITPEAARESTYHTRKSYAKLALVLTIAATCTAAYIFGIHGNISLPLMYGDRAAAIVAYSGFYAMGIAGFTAASAITTYYLAKKKYVFTVFSAILVLWQAVAFTLWHDSIAAFTSVMFVSGITQLGMIAALYAVRPLLQYTTNFTLDLFALFTHLPRITAPPHKLRILIFNWRDTHHAFAGGAEVYVHEISRQWVKQGHSVTQFSGNDGKHARTETVDGVYIIRRGGTYTVYFWAMLYYIFRLRGKYDVIIDCENGIPFFTPFYAWNIPKFLVIFHVHQHVFRSYLSFPARIVASFLERTLTPFVYQNERVITISPSTRQELLSVGMATEGKVQIIEPGVRPVVTFAEKTPYPSFLYLGRLKHYKNVDVAVKAFARLSDRYPDARLVIAGGGELQQQLKQLAEKLGVRDSVQFYGHVTEKLKRQLLTESWAALQPSSYEGWGLTVIEANAAGTPVIASNVPGLKDSVVPEKTGILVAKGSVPALSRAMEQIMTDHGKREQLSFHAREWADKFRWDLSAKKFIETAYAAVRAQKAASL